MSRMNGIITRACAVALCLAASVVPLAHATPPSGQPQTVSPSVPAEITTVPEMTVIKMKSSFAVKQGVALVVPRSRDSKITKDILSQLGEQVITQIQNPQLKLVSLQDLYGNSYESNSGSVDANSRLDFANNQTACQEALTHGIGMVLYIDLTHFNAGKVAYAGLDSKTGASSAADVEQTMMSILTARASLNLFNAADGVRIFSVDKDVKVRGVSAADLSDKAINALAKGLGAESDQWKVPTIEVKVFELELQAKLEGFTFPSFVAKGDSGADIGVVDYPILIDGASVEMDGVLMGKSPCKIEVTGGQHRLRVTRPGFKAFDAVINVTASNRYDALLVLEKETRLEMERQMEKLEELKAKAAERASAKLIADEELKTRASERDSAKLIAEAQAERIKGVAQYFRQSGYRVDIRKGDFWNHPTTENK